VNDLKSVVGKCRVSHVNIFQMFLKKAFFSEIISENYGMRF